MVRRKISDFVEGIVFGFLRQNWSHRRIQKVLKEIGHSVSLGAIHNIRHSKGLQRTEKFKQGKSGTFNKRPTAATRDVVSKIRKMIAKANPPTQREMASHCGVSLGTVNRIIKKILNAKLRKKHKVHKLNDSQIQKRRERSMLLYRKLRNQKWKNFVTTDEAMFYMGGSYGRRKVCYMREGETDHDKLKFVKRDSFAPGFMVWAGVSYYGKTSLRIIDRGVKVNSDYYINKVLKPFLDKDVPRMFPAGKEKDMVFHQDSASSHTAKKTIEYLKKRKTKFITPDEWMPKSPDAAPMDYGIWGILKRRLQKRKIYTMNGLKNALKDEWNKLEQKVINKTLASWSKRCRMIYYCHGSQIEHLLQ